jgi:hypothetical protein
VGLRIRRTIRVLPGLRVNVGKSGVSLSVGGRGATVNVSKRGTYGTVGIPGTGISYRQRLGQSSSNVQAPSSNAQGTGIGLLVVVAVLMVGLCVAVLH